jgi:hypothetical protein
LTSEFELIARHFTRPVRHTVLGVGDDGAVVRPSPGMDLVVSTDMLVAGTHFLAGTDPEARLEGARRESSTCCHGRAAALAPSPRPCRSR